MTSDQKDGLYKAKAKLIEKIQAIKYGTQCKCPLCSEESRKRYTPPRYDDVHFEGVAYLDAIARGETDG